MPLVKTFAEACKHKKMDPKKVVPIVAGMPRKHRKALLAAAKLFIIVDVLNDGHKFNWDDYDELKWGLWWYMNKPGFRLCGAGYVGTFTYVGSRLCFKTKAIAEHAAKHFLPLFKDLYVQ